MSSTRLIKVQVDVYQHPLCHKAIPALGMTKQKKEAGSIANRKTVLVIAMAVLLLFCVAGAVWTAYWSLRFGLTPRPRLSAFQTVIRFVVVITAFCLAWVRTDMLERGALISAVVAAGSSGLYGLGINSVSLQVVRLLFHFIAYTLGVVAITRWFLVSAGDFSRDFVHRA